MHIALCCRDGILILWYMISSHDRFLMFRDSQKVHTGEQEPGGPGRGTRDTTRRACTPVNRSRGAQDTVHTTPHTERAHR